jgi:hypothetical protein
MTNGNDLVNSFIGDEANQPNYRGLTKREYFAALAMQGVCANHANTENAKQDSKWIAETATIIADSLIKELNK